MSKLIAAAQANPTDARIDKLRKYLEKHMMAICMATPEELAFLKKHNLA